MSKLFDAASHLENATSQFSDVIDSLEYLLGIIEDMGSSPAPSETKEERAFRLAWVYDHEVPPILFTLTTLIKSCYPAIQTVDDTAKALYAMNQDYNLIHDETHACKEDSKQ